MLTATDKNNEPKPNFKANDPSKSKRNLRRESRLWHQSEQPIQSLGCTVCPQIQICGGLRFKEPIVFDCLQLCCNQPDGCDRVCRNNPDYPERVREVNGFDLKTIPRAQALVIPNLPNVVPIIYHRNRRIHPPKLSAVALSLYSLFDRKSGSPKFASNDAICSAFCISPGSTILLTGTDRDLSLERWWELGARRRRKIIHSMKETGVELVTTPNYSLFVDRPRWDDLHSMKRIAIIHEEFLREGLPAALHVNGRTESDFQRWAEFLRDRTEITHLAYEFTTGTSRARRQQQHALWLAELAGSIEHPLHIVLRGGQNVLPVLARAFASLTVLDTSTFIKTMKRQRAYLRDNRTLDWRSSPTLPGATLDGLFAENHRIVEAWLEGLIAITIEQVRKAG